MKSSHEIAPRCRQSLRIVASVFALAVFAVAFLPASFAGEELPSAASVLDGFVEATGGGEAYAKLENRVVKGNTEFVTQGIVIPFTAYQGRPIKTYVLSESDVLGKVERGTDGKVVWEKTLMGGAQIKEGGERALVLYSATFDAVPNWRRYFENVELVGVEDLGGEPCYKIRLESKIGIEETRYFHHETRLLVKIEMTLDLPMGKIPMETWPSDYREVDGILMAHGGRVKIAGQERLTTMEKIEHNVELPEGVFEVPAEIQELAAREAATPTT